MPHHASARLAPCVLLALLALVGCSASRPTVEPDPLLRPSDRLLEREDLQAVVDLGVLRDAAALADALSDPDPAVRARAASLLGSVQEEAAIPALQAALRDSIPGVRADAAWAIGQTADSSATPFLFLALRVEGTPAVQRELLGAIGKIGSRSDGDELLRLPIAREREADRMMALARLAMRDRLSPAAFAVVAQRLRSPDALARQHAAYVFARSSGWGAQADLVRDAVDARSPDPIARFHLTQALGRLREAADTDRLADALRDDDWRVRVKAATALGALTESEDAREALFDALDDEIVHVQIEAASALGGAEALPGQDVDRAAVWIASHDSTHWQAAAALLPALARDGRAAAIRAWIDRQSSPFARAAGIGAQAFLDDPDSLDDLLTDSHSEDSRIRTAALSAAASRWRRTRAEVEPDPYFYLFRDAALSGDAAAVTVAASVLSDSIFLDFGAPDILRSAYADLTAPADLEPMVAVLNAIGQLREEGEIDFLVDIALGANDPALKRAAVDALNDRLVDGIDVDIDLPESQQARPTTAIDWAFLSRLGPAPRMLLTTTRGEIVIEMDTETAPQTVQSLTRTAREGLYDGAPFHRVVPAFVAQGGDYFQRDGWGGPETPIRSEFSRRTYRTGVAGMASSGRDTEGVQFFFMHAPHPHLDGRYTIWGHVVEGQEVVDALRVGDVIVTARVLPDPTVIRDGAE